MRAVPSPSASIWAGRDLIAGHVHISGFGRSAFICGQPCHFPTNFTAIQPSQNLIATHEVARFDKALLEEAIMGGGHKSLNDGFKLAFTGDVNMKWQPDTRRRWRSRTKRTENATRGENVLP